MARKPRTDTIPVGDTENGGRGLSRRVVVRNKCDYFHTEPTEAVERYRLTRVSDGKRVTVDVCAEHDQPYSHALSRNTLTSRVIPIEDVPD